jgi:hypothetical protein
MRTIIAACLVCVLSLSCDRQKGTNVPATQQPGEMHDLSFRQAVDAMKSLQTQREFPKHLLRKDATKRGDEFDVQRYFSVLKHISMEEGYVLDYVYQYFEIGGRPVLYARKKTQPPCETETDLKNSVRKEAHLDEVDAAYDEYRAATRNPGRDEAKTRAEADARLESRLAAIPDYAYWEWYLRHVRIDGTKQGYLEYVALSVLGRQFYLFWHENYNDTRIICDRFALEKILDEVAPAPPGSSKPSTAKVGKDGDRRAPSSAPFGWVADAGEMTGGTLTTTVLTYPSIESSAELRTKALQIDPTPVVEIGDRETTVTIVTFSKWGGFDRWHFTISTKFPHRLLDSSKEELASYICGTVF